MNISIASGKARGVVRPAIAVPAQSYTLAAPPRLSPSVLALTPPVALFAAGHRGEAVVHWSLEHRLLKAAEYGVRTLPTTVQAEILELFTPENAAITGGVMVAWVASHAYGVGEVVDAALFAFAVFTAGRQAFGGGRDLGRFAAAAATARSEADLRAAGHWFAQAVLELGVATVTAIILKRGVKVAGAADEATAAEAGASGLSAPEVDALAERLITKRFGSTQNVGTQVVANVKTIVRFLSGAGLKEEKMLEVLRGIDLHAAQPVEIVEFERGEVVAQFAQDGQTGSWFTRAPRGATQDDLGISAGQRTRKLFRIKSPVKMLKSRAASVVDTWTEGRQYQVFKDSVNPKLPPGQYTRGGGEQFFLPNARQYVEDVK